MVRQPLCQENVVTFIQKTVCFRAIFRVLAKKFSQLFVFIGVMTISISFFQKTYEISGLAQNAIFNDLRILIADTEKKINEELWSMPMFTSTETEKSLPIDFYCNKNRDAHATIRGFVYQVDLTILRWLDLRTNQVLELESGEDIDLVDISPVELSKRLLEQVKHRESNITLRSKSVLETIKNAIEHRKNNPRLDIIVRFSTNSNIGREQLLPKFRKSMPKGMGFLNIWESLRKNEEVDISRTEAIHLIRSFIKELQEPEGFSSWLVLQNFFQNSNDEDIDELICHVEWSVGEPDSGSMQRNIENKLVLLVKAGSLQAEQLYHRLFLAVFKLLCQKGPKRLTVEMRDHALSTYMLSETDHQILLQLQTSLGHQTKRIDVLEATVCKLSSDFVTTLAIREQLPSLNIEPTFLSTNPPTLPDNVIQRQSTIEKIIQDASSASWIAIHGNRFSGKTTIAALLSEQLQRRQIWIPIESAPNKSAILTIEMFFSALYKPNPEWNREIWYNELCSSFNNDTTFIFDNIPDLANNPELKDRLIVFCKACRNNNIRLITTGLYPLPQSVLGSFVDQSVWQVSLPPFTKDEIADFLQRYGAPSEICQSAFVNLFHVKTAGHPLLLMATAIFLQQHGWQFDNNTFNDFLKDNHIHEVAEDILRYLMVSENENSRDLLYRLNLVRYEFQRDVVDAIGEVTPAIPRPQEVFTGMIGPWVRRIDSQKFELSPLITSLHVPLLDSRLARDCHEALGNLIMTKRTIDSLEVIRAILHFQSAELFDRMAILFVIALQLLSETKAPSPNEMILDLWDLSRMPEEINSSIRFFARAMQLNMRNRLGLDNSEVMLNDFRLLFDEIDINDNWSVICGAFIGNMVFAKSDPCFSHKLLLLALRELPNFRDPKGNLVEVPPEMGPEKLLMSTVDKLKTHAEFEDWICTLEAFSCESLARIRADSDLTLMSIIYVDRIVQVETEKSPSEHDLRAALFFLSQIAQKAENLALSTLQGAAIRGQIRISAEYLKRPEEALQTAKTAMNSQEPIVRYLASAEFGRQMDYVKRYADAKHWLQLAIIEEPEGIPIEPILIRRAASVSFGQDDPQLGEQYAKEALELAKTEETYPVTELAALAASYAYAVFLNQGSPACVEAWQAAANLVLDAETDTEDWRCVFTTFAHATAHVVSIVETGSPPELGPDGNEWSNPPRESFFVRNNKLAGLYEPSKKAGLLYFLGKILESYSLEKSNKWYTKAETTGKAFGNQLIGALASIHLVDHRIQSRQWEELLAQTRWAHIIIRKSTNILLANQQNINLDAENQIYSLDDINHIEEGITESAIFPSIIDIMRLSIISPDEAQQEGIRFANACRIASTEMPALSHWNTFIEIIESTFVRPANHKVLFNLVEGNMPYLICTIGRLCAGHVGSAKEAFMENLVLLPPLTERYKCTTQIYRLLLSYLGEFWMKRIEEQRFSFSNPSLVHEELLTACCESEDKRLKAILRAVSNGIRIQGVPTETSLWLWSEK